MLRPCFISLLLESLMLAFGNASSVLYFLQDPQIVCLPFQRHFQTPDFDYANSVPYSLQDLQIGRLPFQRHF